MGLFFYWGPCGPDKVGAPVDGPSGRGLTGLGLRVLRFDTAFQAVRVVVGACGANINKTFKTALAGEGKTS